MNKQNISILDSMTVREYKEFLKNALGFCIFNSLNRNDSKLVLRRTKPKEKFAYIEKDEKITRVAYLYENEGFIDVYYFTNSQYKNKKFSNLNGNELNARTYFDVLKDDIVLFLLIGSKEKVEPQFIFEKITDAYSIINSLDIDKFRYSFILGTGISLCFGVKKWSDLISEIESSLSNDLKTNDDKLLKFQNEIGNTSYILPQVKKDYSRETYFKIIYDSLYANFNNQTIDINTNPDLENQAVYQVANILSAQTLFNEKQEVLTFNYDNFLEKVLEANYSSVTIESVYKNNNEKNDAGIQIVHSHGFLPFEDFDDIHKESIVLSSFEYMDTYKNNNSYAYRKLYEQLNKTNIIIGNSISDYEEQKVFRNHHNEYLSSFSFVLLKKSDELWMDNYKTKYLFSLGVIPLFFNDYQDISNFLRDRITNL